MATSAFKSTTRRSSGIVGPDDAASCTRDPTRPRLCRRLSGVPLPDELLSTPAAQTRGRFVNTERGSGSPDVRLDGLADEFFPVKDWEEELERRRDWGRGRSARRLSGFAMETESSKRRGRSVSRKSRDSVSKDSKGASGVRGRRSVSVAGRHVVGETEDDMNVFHRSSSQQTKQETLIGFKANFFNHVSQKSTIHRDLQQSHDTCSSQSSSLTDDDACSVNTIKSRHEKIITTVHAEKNYHPIADGGVSGLYQAMRQEVRDAVDDIRIELEKVMLNAQSSMMPDGSNPQADGSNVTNAIAEIKRSYASELEESEKRKQRLQAEWEAEEYCEEELTKIVEGLFPEIEENMKEERPSRVGEESMDKTWNSDQLIEAEKCFEDFISNVGGTCFSSFDDEKSDATSSVEGSVNSTECLFLQTFPEAHKHLAEDGPTAENDGVVLPWLQWETEYDSSLSNKERVMMLTAENNLNNTLQEVTTVRETNNSSPSSCHNRCDSSDVRAPIHENKNDDKTDFASIADSYQPVNRSGCHSFDVCEYMGRQRDEDLLLEMHKQKQRIDSGSLVLCRRPFGSYLF